MPKKNWTPEERKAFGDKMKAARSAKQDENVSNPVSNPEPQPEQTEQIAPEQDINQLLKQIEELKQSQALMQAAILGQQKGGSGTGNIQATQAGLVGTFEKYLVDPALYPDPSARLAEEPRLAPWAFNHNYELDFKVTVSSYQTKDGINTKEPKFNMELRRIVLDEDTGEPTKGRYIVRKLVFHEDPQAALTIARDNGVNIDEMDERTFLNEMRYLRARDWLLDIFYPPKSDTVNNKKQMVIDGRVVDYFEINSEDSQVIPFSSLKTKL